MPRQPRFDAVRSSSPSTSRRAYLATAAAAASAGCLGALVDHDPAPGRLTVGDRTVDPEVDGSLPTPARDWPTYQFDARNRGYDPAAGTAAGHDPEVRWRARVATEEDVLRGAPALRDGSVFVTTEPELVVLDARTGSRRWSTPFPEDGWTGPTVTGERVFVGTERGVVAIDRGARAVRWSRHTGSSLPYENPAVSGAPTVGDGRVYAGTFDGAIHAFDARTAERTWHRSVETLPYESDDPGPANAPAFSGPVGFAGGTVYAANRNGVLYAFDGETGAERWRFAADGEHVDMLPAPTALEGTVVAASEVALRGFDPADGTVEWRFGDDPGSMSYSTVVSDDDVFVASGPVLESQDVVGLGRRDRRVRWRRPGRVQESFSADDALLYVPLYGRLVALDRASGEIAWEMTTRSVVSGPPALADGIVVAADEAGTIYGIGRAR